MECCGKERTTKFCCDCGKALDYDPIYSLMAHLTSMARKYKGSFTNQKAKGYETSAAISKKASEKWKLWENALRELLLK